MTGSPRMGIGGLHVGQVWEAPLGNRYVHWTVTWIGTKKVRLKADLDYGWANCTADIARMLDSPDWRRIPTGDGSTQQVTEAARARPKPKRGPVI